MPKPDGYDDWTRLIEDVRAGELDKVDFDAVLSESDMYYVKPTVAVGLTGEPQAVYGIFNKETHVCEAETRQFAATRQWVTALERVNKKNPDEAFEIMDMNVENTIQ